MVCYHKTANLLRRLGFTKKQIDDLRSNNNAFVVRVLKQLNTLESKLDLTPRTVERRHPLPRSRAGDGCVHGDEDVHDRAPQ